MTDNRMSEQSDSIKDLEYRLARLETQEPKDDVRLKKVFLSTKEFKCFEYSCG